MKELVLPVPHMVSATYVVPVPTLMGMAEARQKASTAVEARLTGPLRTLTAEWLAKGVVKVGVEAAGPPPPGLLDKKLFGTPEQRVFLAHARAFVKFSATQRASLIGMQEWKARGPAAALAAELGAPVLDPQALQVLTAEDALAALPDTTLTIPASISNDITIGLTFKSWVRVHDVGYQGVIAVMTDGMCRFRIWSDLIARARDTPKAAGLLHLPRFLRVPAEMDIHRRDLDRANGVPNRGGMRTIIGLQFDPPTSEDPEGWLTICPPACWDESWEDFIADTCQAMFGFEKPRWHYNPEFGALMDALTKAAQTLPEARSRFMSGDLPPGGRLMIRYNAADADELRWARVESWEDAGHPVIRDIGRELAPGVRLGAPVEIEARFIADWGIWVDGSGVIEGAETEGAGHHLQ
jgi:hypothetical protein